MDMGTLTLARYVLETSLMSLALCRVSESLIAASCLLLAKRMKAITDDWVGPDTRPQLAPNKIYKFFVIEIRWFLFFCLFNIERNFKKKKNVETI